MENPSILLEKYIARSMPTVTGYLTTLDAHLIAALLSGQHEHGIAGHLCEIGVHHGRLFFLLALARRAGERSLAIDLFEDDEMTTHTSHAGRDRALFTNADRLNITLGDEEIFKSSSLDIETGDIQKRTSGGIRFFSVDGCHYRKFVENDLNLAAKTLTADGVIAVDDFFNISWPDVTSVTCAFLQKTDAVVPFALTASKLYLAPPAAAEQYKRVLNASAALPGASSVEFLGQHVLIARHGVVQRGYDALRGLIASRAPFASKRH